jgi:hypothetical protein
MKLKVPRTIATIGGILIAISGVVNMILGARIGAVLYDVYPGGRMGHVGIIAGIAAIAIGLAIVLLVAPIYARKSRAVVILGGILTAVLGHLGAIAGALFVGTAGVISCYIAGIWAIVIAVRHGKKGADNGSL